MTRDDGLFVRRLEMKCGEGEGRWCAAPGMKWVEIGRVSCVWGGYIREKMGN